MKKQKKSQAGITLIALVISIIVMLILVGVSLNATIGENGIITQAQEATYMQGLSELQEFINQYYVEHYDEFEDYESKVVGLANGAESSNWFFHAPLGYIIDVDGYKHYFINYYGLPEDIRSNVIGGTAGGKKEGEITYRDYASLKDVYGVTSNLEVYYYKNSNELMGTGKFDLEDETREVYANGTNLQKALSAEGFDYNGDGVINVAEARTIRKLTLDQDSGITNLSDFYNLPALQELHLKNLTLTSLDGLENCTKLSRLQMENCTSGNYKALRMLSSTLNKLYFVSIDDKELNAICDTVTGMGGVDYANLTEFGVLGDNHLLNVNGEVDYTRTTRGQKSITSLKPLSNISISTQKKITRLLLNGNYITDDKNSNGVVEKYALENISEFTSVTNLRVEGNSLTTLKGIEKFNSLSRLFASSNKLGINDSLENDIDTNALKALKGKSSLTFVRLEWNSNLARVDYLNLNNKIGELYLEGCSSTMAPATISTVLAQCGAKYSLPAGVKYLTGAIYKLSDYYNGSTVKYSDLYSDLYGNKNITHLSLKDCKTLTNAQFETILSSMTELQYLDLNGCTNLSTIDFVGKDKATKLIQLCLIGTGVTDLTNLNTYGSNIKSLQIDNADTNLDQIIPTINHMGTNYYWKSPEELYVDGLYCTKFSVLKKLEGKTNLTNFCSVQYAKPLYEVTETLADGTKRAVTLDLSGTSITDFTFSGCYFKVILPSTITKVFMDQSWPPTLSSGTGAVSSIQLINSYNPCTKEQYWVDFFSSLKNCTSISQFILNRCKYFTDLTLLSNATGANIWTFKFSGRIEADSEVILTSVDGVQHLSKTKEFIFTTIPSLNNVDKLGSVTWAEKITIQKTGINSIEWASTIPNLTQLDVCSNNISKIGELGNLSRLYTLKLENNSIPDSSEYMDMFVTLRGKNLRKLYLKDNLITDFSKISGLKWEDKSGF